MVPTHISGPRRVVGHRTRGLKGVVPFGVDIDRAARRGDRITVISLLQRSKIKLIEDRGVLEKLLSTETSTKRQRELLKQIRVVDGRLEEVGHHLR